MLLGLHFIYLFTPILKADAPLSGELGEGKGKESAARERFLQGCWLGVSGGTHPMEGRERASGNEVLPLPTSDKNRCSQLASEIGKGIPAAGIRFIEAEKDPRISHLLF